MHHFKFILAAALLNLQLIPAFGQGCSDAGFCTLNALKSDQTHGGEEEMFNLMKVGLTTGEGDHGISIFTTYLEYSRNFNSRLSINAKVSYMVENGTLTRSSGFSDIYITGNYQTKYKITLTGGLKLPLTDGNRQFNGQALPMNYQTSLGTVDLILGLGYTVKNLFMTLAIQQPLSQNNNTFLVSDFPAGTDYQNFRSTNGFIRKTDMMFRLSYRFEAGKKIRIIPGVLPIYHLANDEFTDSDGQVKEIEGSQGLTLNGTLFLEYSINGTNRIELNYGMPFITRKSRPDGLTREYVLGLEYSIAF